MSGEHSPRNAANLRWRFTSLTTALALMVYVSASPLFTLHAQNQSEPVPYKNTPAAECRAPEIFDTIVVGAGISGLSAAKELQQLKRSVLVLEANSRIGGRGYVAKMGEGDKQVSIDYGGAWIHGVPTNPLTGLVDDKGLTRIRTNLDVDFFQNKDRADKAGRDKFTAAVEAYEAAAGMSSASQESQQTLAHYACSALEQIDPVKDDDKKKTMLAQTCNLLEEAMPDNRSVATACTGATEEKLSDLCMQAKQLHAIDDTARDYAPLFQDYQEVIDLLVANAGPLETAADLDNTSAVDAANFAAGEDDLVKEGLGTFVEKLGDNLPICTGSRVSQISRTNYGTVLVRTQGRTFEARHVLVTVSVGVLKTDKTKPGHIDFDPALPKEKTDAINDLAMGNMQKIIMPFTSDIFGKFKDNSWVLYQGTLPPDELTYAKNHTLPLAGPEPKYEDKKEFVMAYVVKPLGKPVVIGFFGGKWASTLEAECGTGFGQEQGSGPYRDCDAHALNTAMSGIYNIADVSQSEVDKSFQKQATLVTRWSLDPTSYGAYSIAPPGKWRSHEILGEPVADAKGAKWLFFAGEATARSIYIGSYPGAYESGLKAAREINEEILKQAEAKKEAAPPAK